MEPQEKKEQPEFTEELVKVKRVAKVVKGGRRFRLSAYVVVGDHNGRVGYGSGKGQEVPNAIQKATASAKKNMISVIRKGTTIPFEVTGRFASSKVLLKPAVEGTGIIAGSAVRSVVESAGIHDIVTKSMGSDNVINIVKATFDAINQLRDKKEVEKLRGVTIE